MTKTEINPDALYWASFNRFELRLSGQCVLDCSHSGDCMADVLAHVRQVRRQIKFDGFPNKPTPDKIRAELAEYGAWDDFMLSCDVENFNRLVWIAANHIAEDEAPDCSEPVK